ncbi:putative oxidoreductase [Gelidibacter algens]|uniref:Putative oxidoreductase n=1 Tax=Gelidibacter algens TaxID=49280 RepID=A0A1A7R0U4_9FLAO|nr:DoxX family protein [Gelidibacter algens]OBX25143.1 DoxX family protein [Gelidibacter algens]RAJ20034.1 putative oxidoreductase [Gelidibacter algens]
MTKNLDLGSLLIRLGIGFPMLVYGISKLQNGIAFITGLLENIGLPQFLGYGVYIGEVIAPILILIGFRTRLASLIFAVNCLTAIGLTQLGSLFKLNPFGGWALELLAIYFLIAMALFSTGGGKFCLSIQNKWD